MSSIRHFKLLRVTFVPTRWTTPRGEPWHEIIVKEDGLSIAAKDEEDAIFTLKKLGEIAPIIQEIRQ